MSAELIAKIEPLATKFAELEQSLGDPALQGTPKFRQVLREHARLSKLMEPYHALVEAHTRVTDGQAMVDDPELGELAAEDIKEGTAACEQAVEDIKALLAQGDPDADRPALLEIRAGTGGDEAALFAGLLARMYSLHAQKRGWKFETIEASNSEAGGIKEGVFMVRGEGAFGLLQYESGGHRVQRVPETESQGRIHTSAATVAVMPEAEDVDIEIRDDDLDIERKRAGGAGGQHVNKTESAIRITHRPTRVVVSCQDEKSQTSNLDRAMKVLRARVYDLERQRLADERASLRRGQVGSGDRSERIRTYNFPQNRITDHRINHTAYNLDKYVEGHLEELQQALIDHAKLAILDDWDGSF